MANDIGVHLGRMIGTAALLLCAAVGCGGSTASAPPASTATSSATAEDDFSAGLSEHHRHHHHGGVTLLITLSLDTLGVSAEQRAAIDKIKADLHGKMGPADAAEHALLALLADGIAAGGIDHQKADAALARVAAATEAAHDATIDALNQLHAALTPPQRVALVDKVEAHWEVWQRANADEEKDATGQPRRGGHLASLAREIGLTQDQLDKIHTNLAGGDKTASRLDPRAMTSHVHAFGDAFRSDTFDAKNIATSRSADGHLAGSGAARMVRFYEGVDPVLAADQRAKLAAILREHANDDPSAKGG
jgi:Spy/CpxP family protein refolding chaperone